MAFLLAKKIYVSTDGIINFINIPALPIDNNAVLGDKFVFTILTSTQDIPTVKKGIHIQGCSSNSRNLF